MAATRDFAYIGRERCGCVTAVRIDTGDAYTRKAVNEFMRDGLTVERHGRREAIDQMSLVCLHKPKFGLVGAA